MAKALTQEPSGLTPFPQADKSERSFERSLRRSLCRRFMPDEIKSPPPPPPENEKPAADKPATPGGVKSTPSGSVQSETTTTPSQPSPPSETSTPPKAAAPATPAKPGAPAAAGHPAPPKPAGPVPTPWDSPLVAKYKREYGSGIKPIDSSRAKLFRSGSVADSGDSAASTR